MEPPAPAPAPADPLAAVDAGVARASRAVGVPLRFAQPVDSGPDGNQAMSAAGTASEAASAPALTPAWFGQPAEARAQTAAITVSTHAPVTRSSQCVFASLPVPRPCTTATGQEAYASQWVERQSRWPRRRRSMLVTVSASSRSNATAPSPSHSGR